MFWIWDFDKEEKWLNEMAAKGLSLVAIGLGKYTFEQADPGLYSIRLEILDKWPTHPESEQYIRFIEDTGAEYLGSLTRWVYFRKKSSEGKFDIYSDFDSRITQLNRILFLLGILSATNILNGFTNAMNYLGTKNVPLLYISIMSFTIGSILLYGVCKIISKRKKLRKEKQIFE